MDHEPGGQDQGSRLDVARIVERRHALKVLGGLGLVTLVGCGSDAGESTPSASAAPSTAVGTAAERAPTAPDTTAASATCTAIPEETAGPFPADGSNGPDLLAEPGAVRDDITTSFGSSSTVAEGVPTTIALTVVSLADGCRPLGGAAVYAWHCDREGRYSMYSEGVEDENYLRGLQEAGADGTVSFRTIFPGTYPGRWPHVHFEVYSSLSEAKSAGRKLATSQLALPEPTCRAAYAADGYEESRASLGRISLDSDMVFADGYSAQLGRAVGDADVGYTVSLTVAV